MTDFGDLSATSSRSHATEESSGGNAVQATEPNHSAPLVGNNNKNTQATVSSILEIGKLKVDASRNSVIYANRCALDACGKKVSASKTSDKQFCSKHQQERKQLSLEKKKVETNEHQIVETKSNVLDELKRIKCQLEKTQRRHDDLLRRFMDLEKLASGYKKRAEVAEAMVDDLKRQVEFERRSSSRAKVQATDAVTANQSYWAKYEKEKQDHHQTKKALQEQIFIAQTLLAHSPSNSSSGDKQDKQAQKEKHRPWWKRLSSKIINSQKPTAVMQVPPPSPTLSSSASVRSFRTISSISTNMSQLPPGHRLTVQSLKLEDRWIR